MKGGAGVEEMFESLIGIAIVVFAIARKFKKNEDAKKAKENPKPAPKMPAEAFETPVKKNPDPAAAKEAAMQVMKLAKQAVMEELLEIEDEEEAPSMEEAIPVPVVIPAAAPAAPVPAAPVVAEGDCAHEEHVPLERHAVPQKPESLKARLAGREEKAVPVKKQAAGRRFDAAAMRRAVVTAEILNRPVSLRKQAR